VQDEVQRLVQGAQDGNLGAFSRLYELFFDRVYRYMMARVGNAAEAEDLTQELFLKVMASLGSYRFQGPPFAAWLFRIAHNLAVDRARRRKSAGESVSLDEALSLPAGGSVEEEALRSLEHQAVRGAIERLTELQRQAVLLRFMAGLSLAETASAMGRNENAVKALQHSALRALRRLLAGQLGEVPAGE
jgi:RNA polymerase sigma-70 factor (ECF subfamily)